MSQQKSSLTRTLRVGEGFSFDNGRIVVTLESQSGKRAKLNFQIDRTIKVDKPPPGEPGKGAGVPTLTGVEHGREHRYEPATRE